ncbi:MAG: hypothetical protein KC414_15645, partial [Romboutsia sp.]|nr:hypothetical protein [Romboutsia sp.]
MEYVSSSNFLLPEVPKLNPLSMEYVTWWREQKRRCIDGYWVGGRYMPGPLYFYVNFWVIKLKKDKGKGEFIGRPMLRDLEWEKSYIFLEASWFSGFSDDDLYTCDEMYRPDVRKVNEDLQVIPRSNIEYIPAREYLRKIHRKQLGKPLFRNQAKNVIDIEARGGGKDILDTEVVITENGPVEIKNIKVGDKIYGSNGRLTNVISKVNFYDQLQYKVTLSDGRSLTTGGGHLWSVLRKSGNKKIKEVKELKDIYKNYKIGKRGDSRYFVKQIKPILYPDRKLPIDPYFFGLWLGDGNSN